jgi:hypothetical protein
MLKRTTALAAAAATSAVAFAAAPAQAEAAPTDAIQPVLQSVPSLPSLPPALSPDIHTPPLGNLTVPISPYIPSLGTP